MERRGTAVAVGALFAATLGGAAVATTDEAPPTNPPTTVTDSGEGIDPDLVPVIFDRLRRSDEARTRAQTAAASDSPLHEASPEPTAATSPQRTPPRPVRRSS